MTGFEHPCVRTQLPLSLMWAGNEGHNQKHTMKKARSVCYPLHTLRGLWKQHQAWDLTQCVWWWFPTSLAAWFVLEGSLPSGSGREKVGGCQDCCWWSYCKSLGCSASLREKRKPKYHWWKHPSLWKGFHLRNHGLGEWLIVERDLLQGPTTWVVPKTHKVKQTNFL